MSSCTCHCKPCYCCPPQKLGCATIILDLFMIVLTGGLWIIWIIIREIRRSR